MADIVERLAGPFIAEPAAQRVMDQAIEEIEHLREWNAEIALNAREFAAENERLRAALRSANRYLPYWRPRTELARQIKLETLAMIRAALDDRDD